MVDLSKNLKFGEFGTESWRGSWCLPSGWEWASAPSLKSEPVRAVEEGINRNTSNSFICPHSEACPAEFHVRSRAVSLGDYRVAFVHFGE